MTAAAERPAAWFAASAEAGRESGARSPRCAAFTLLEILLGLALLALLIGASVSISANLIGTTPVTAEDVFWQAVSEARKQALLSRQDVHLNFEEKEKAFVLTTEN